MIITREERMRANFEAVREYELSESRKQGIEQGLEKGFAQGLMQTAQNMLKDQFDIETIVKITGLTVEEIEAISL